MSIFVKVILITYAILTGVVSLVALKNKLTKKYSTLGFLASLILVVSIWWLDIRGIFSFLTSVVALALIQVQTYLNGKSLYDQIHLSHHIVRLCVHIGILILVGMAAFNV